jgi:hypothetical protein
MWFSFYIVPLHLRTQLSRLFRRAIVDSVTSRTAIRVRPVVALRHRRKRRLAGQTRGSRENYDVCE